LHSLALKLPRAADRGGVQAGALFGRLLIVPTQLHLAIDAFALELLLEHPHSLIDIIVANHDLHLLPLSKGAEAGWRKPQTCRSVQLSANWLRFRSINDV
jgi:hypothetical protein